MYVFFLVAVILQLLTRHIAVFLPAVMPIVTVGMFSVFFLSGILVPKYLLLSSLFLIPTLVAFVDVQQGFLGFGERVIVLYGILLSISLSYLKQVTTGTQTRKQNSLLITFLCTCIGIGLGIGNFLVFPNHFFFLGTEISLKIITSLCLFAIAEEFWLRRLLYTLTSFHFGSGPAILLTTLAAATLGITGNINAYWLTYITHLLLTLLYIQTNSLRLSILTNISLKVTYYLFSLTLSTTIVSPFTL